MLKSCQAQKLLNYVVLIVGYILIGYYAFSYDSDSITISMCLSAIGDTILWCVAIWSSLTLVVLAINNKIKEEIRLEKTQK